MDEQAVEISYDVKRESIAVIVEFALPESEGLDALFDFIETHPKPA